MREEGRGKTYLWLALAAVTVGVAIVVLLLTRQDTASTMDAVSRHAGEKENHPTVERTVTV
ncbi:MAG: hypothetical protein KBT68_04235, partial [bacterium]|nr:hypothetical protein [Candidatus Colisoma equi]